MPVRLAETTPAAPAPTISAVALTTTFTPPAQCNENHLTMLVGALEKIWINEPVPLPNQTTSSCYPSEWLGGYESVMSKSSSIAPYMSPLVCPDGWNTESSTWANGYIACCASGFTFAAPSKAADTDRPAYGGTCYSNFDLSQTATVTVYNAEELSTTIAWVATTTPAQAYAHPIEGIAADYTPSSTGRSTGTGTNSAGVAVKTGENAAPQRGGNSRAAFVIGFLLASLVAW
ncbi:CFEM domain protein [Colletotrichum tofieldiae]|uniref:CFEM domain protein n=1 Tax=Colletotrichum tofieldiae TaxID=708197 RepID=A0A166YMD5_9PEZI|nr:CFEM domain protein [Colletotrichum tofieldiae]GKT59732.1 CFEM domain protein [Colletotrichum tofieldiae]GKT78532.1 CFEM domain protein [Colletotrichum tofieldiae]GKT85902.1 CFEM domain protein [Colletotrichum tofieldiae]